MKFLLKLWMKIGFLILPDLYKEHFKRMPLFHKIYHAYDIIKIKRKYKKNRNRLGIGNSLVSLYKGIDDYIKEYRKVENPTITCKKGCSFCCHKQVFISDDEAKVLFKYAQDNHIAIDLQKAHFQVMHKPNVPYPHSGCIFLDNDTRSCKVYSVRPISCRALHASTNPQFCFDDKNNQPAYLVLPKIENIKTAVWNSSISGNLPDMILKQVSEAK